MQIRKFKDVLEETKREIHNFQTGKRKIIKTNRPWLDDIFPVVNGTVITISAQSGVGKSTEMMKTVNNIMNVNINPSAVNFVSLIVSLEMKVLNIVLRGLSYKTKKKKSEIIKEEFTPEELELAKEYFKSLEDDRNFISQTPTTSTLFYEECDKFLEHHKDKETVLICYDHLALTSSNKGESRNTVIENLIEAVNNLKMKYSNAVFILVSQTNSDLVSRSKDKDVMSQPRPSDLYYSQFTFQISDYVVVINNPLKNNIKEYSKVYPDRYPNLEKYFLEEDNKGRVSLETYGVNYIHLLKCRESDDGMYLDIYAEELNIPNVEKTRKENKTTALPNFSFSQTPSFDSTPDLTKHETSFVNLNKAFDIAPKEDKKDSPF